MYDYFTANLMFLGRSGGPLGSAKISIREPRMDSDGEPYLPIYYDFPIGIGHSLDENSALVKPLVKPFRNILKEGKPAEEILFVFHEENQKDYFVLGSFVKTIGNKILFFPGLKFSRIIHTPTGKDLKNEELHNIDHFTLENKNLSRWHVTLVQKSIQGIRYPILRTKAVNDNAFLWFLMAIKDHTALESMPRTQEYRLKGPPTDLKRRFQNMTKSIEGKPFQVTSVKSRQAPPTFLNFEVFVTRGGELYPPRDVFVIPSPISVSSDNKQEIQSRVHDFCLDQTISISIRVYKISGSIMYDGIYFPGKFWL